MQPDSNQVKERCRSGRSGQSRKLLNSLWVPGVRIPLSPRGGCHNGIRFFIPARPEITNGRISFSKACFWKQVLPLVQRACNARKKANAGPSASPGPPRQVAGEKRAQRVNPSIRLAKRVTGEKAHGVRTPHSSYPLEYQIINTNLPCASPASDISYHLQPSTNKSRSRN